MKDPKFKKTRYNPTIYYSTHSKEAEERAMRFVELRKTINPKTRVFYRLKEIALIEHQLHPEFSLLSRERIRQILFINGVSGFVNKGLIIKKEFNLICPQCNKNFSRYYKIARFCSRLCASTYHRKWSDKPIKELTSEELKARYKKRNNALRGKRHNYYQRPEIKARMRAYQRSPKARTYRKMWYKRNKLKILASLTKGK